MKCFKTLKKMSYNAVCMRHQKKVLLFILCILVNDFLPVQEQQTPECFRGYLAARVTATDSAVSSPISPTFQCTARLLYHHVLFKVSI